MFVQLRNISVSEDYKRGNPRYKRDLLNCWIIFQCPHCTVSEYGDLKFRAFLRRVCLAETTGDLVQLH